MVKQHCFPRPVTHRYTHLNVGRNKPVRALAQDRRFRHSEAWECRKSFRSSATAPALLYLLHNPQGCGECRFCMEQKSVHAVVLTPLAYIPVGKAHPGYRRAGLLVPCGYSVLERVYKDERPVIPAILPGMTLFRKHLCMSRYQLRTLCLLRVALARTARPAVPPKNESPVLYLFGYKCAFR